ncbi:MAG: regulatory iron-sulfur-containing complex subunit RicT [Bacteroidales bacterium]
MKTNSNNNISSDTNPEKIQENIKNSAQRSGSNKLYCTNWLQDISDIPATHNIVEVRFKNTRKEFYVNNNNLSLETGDIVAVESSPGHDIGIVSLTGELVKEQLKKIYKHKIPEKFNTIYRKAKPNDIEKWEEAKALEHPTMIKTRQIAKSLKLNMKIGDVEYQGDKTKAIFYYIADERVDFRELIKVLADEFKIKIEMKQIGARQEAGRIGGIGPCGRDLCCSSFKTNFNTVSTSAARVQELSLNPQKLAGQCGKLKCCLNYELKSYEEARKEFPDTSILLEFEGGVASHSKTDVYKKTMCYFYKKDDVPAFAELSIERIKEIIELNKKGIKPEKLELEKVSTEINHDYTNVVGEESLTRFDNKNKKKKRKGKGNRPQNKQASDNKNNKSNNQNKPNNNKSNKPNNKPHKNKKPRNKNTNNPQAQQSKKTTN